MRDSTRGTIIHVARDVLGYLFLGVAVVLVAITILLPFQNPSWFTNDVKGVILAFWLTVPPLWFWIEYIFLFRKDPKGGDFEAFRYGQEVSRNLWIGISAALALLYFGHSYVIP